MQLAYLVDAAKLNGQKNRGCPTDDCNQTLGSTAHWYFLFVFASFTNGC